jgi:hypothetical protein
MPVRYQFRMFMVATLAAAGCTQAPGPSEAPVATSSSFAVPAAAPDLVVRGPEQDHDLIAAATRLTSQNPTAQPPRLLGTEFVPLLFSAPAGIRFVAIEGERALAEGAPEASCPALAPAAGTSLAAAVAGALAECRAQLTAAGAPPTCGCRLIAANASLLAPPPVFAYARGLSTRVFRRGKLDPTHYVAEERLAPDGSEATLVFAGTRPVWLVRRLSTTTAEIVALDRMGKAGPAVPAKRQLIGLDRGRIRERITTKTPEGVPLTFLVGF